MYWLLEACILKYRYIHELIYAVFGVCLVCPVRMHAHSAGISSWVCHLQLRYGMTIILERLCISPTEAIRQGDKPYMQQASFFISESFSVFVVSNSGSVPARIPLLARANCLTTTVSRRVSPVVFDCLQPITSRPREKLASTPTPCGMIENMSRATLERSAYFECVSSCCRRQSGMSGIQNVLLISIGSEW